MSRNQGTLSFVKDTFFFYFYVFLDSFDLEGVCYFSLLCLVSVKDYSSYPAQFLLHRYKKNVLFQKSISVIIIQQV